MSGSSGIDYSKKIKSPIYEPKNEKPKVSDLYFAGKALELIEKIKVLGLEKEEEDFLVAAARRHTVFHYQRIADYYAHSRKEIQGVMEDSALVIIDFDKAIEHGFVELTNELSELYAKEKGDA